MGGSATAVLRQARRRVGQRTWAFEHPPVILATAGIAGPMEGRGPLGDRFDEVLPDQILGQKSWEQAEVKMMERAVSRALTKAGLREGDIDVLVCGDLLNQLGASTFAARTLDMPFLGVYAACSCWTEGLSVGAALIDGGFASRAAVATSSHHLSAERQFRYPIEFAVQRVPTATWTVTGAGAAVIAREGDGPRITHATLSRLVDAGFKDPLDLGSAMAPAAADTLAQHFKDTGRLPQDYDLILTGDLGRVGKPMVEALAAEVGFNLTPVLDDCGIRIYDEAQDVHGGGSGCACSALTFSADVMPRLADGSLGRVLLCATGAMFSPTSYQQGESIPCVAYAVALEGAGR